MTSYLSEQMTAEELVISFFRQRSEDLDKEIGCEWNPTEDRIRWESLYAKLFWACEDVDILPDTNGEGEPHWIDRATFHAMIKDVLSEFQRFQLLRA
jgi:hypothetical protein